MSTILTLVTAVGFVLLIVCVPAAINRPTRGYYGFACFLWGLLCLLTLIVQSAQIVAMDWGKAVAVFGLCIGIVPIIPLAFLASLFTAQWALFFWTVDLHNSVYRSLQN